MLLGDVLAQFDDETVAAETILALGDLALVARLRCEAESNAQTLGAYASGMVGRYAATASDEEWIGLMSALQSAPDPGAVCLKRALTSAVVAPRDVWITRVTMTMQITIWLSTRPGSS
jgi:hypothetical protein